MAPVVAARVGDVPTGVRSPIRRRSASPRRPAPQHHTSRVLSSTAPTGWTSICRIRRSTARLPASPPPSSSGGLFVPCVRRSDAWPPGLNWTNPTNKRATARQMFFVLSTVIGRARPSFRHPHSATAQTSRSPTTRRGFGPGSHNPAAHFEASRSAPFSAMNAASKERCTGLRLSRHAREMSRRASSWPTRHCSRPTQVDAA